MQHYTDNKRLINNVIEYFRRHHRLKTTFLHLEIWAFVFFFFYVGEIRLSHSFAMWDSLMVVISQAVIFYGNIYYNRKAQPQGEGYRIKSIVLVVALSIVDTLIEYATQIRQYYGVSGNVDDWYTLFSVVLFISFNMSAYLASEFIVYRRESHRHQMQIEQLKKEKTESQLELLRARINPHFLFNSLNTIYAMSYLEDPNTPQKIMKLSDLLRYVLYECNDDDIPLEKEINYLTSYIEFNRDDDDSHNISFIAAADFHPVKIAPMILLSFLENAYKHSRILYDRKAYIHIVADVDENAFYFSIANSLPPQSGQNHTTPYSGIGLENIRKRLDILYPDNYSLQITRDAQQYSVRFTLKLKHYERKQNPVYHHRR
ncbi:MAG: histidine kinase [Tannerella sp.]|nr:histidine kinase [Tannerella sp.]